MKTKFKESFIENYKKLVISQNTREAIMLFNKRISQNEFLLVYPFSKNDENNEPKMSLLVGFSDEAKVFKVCEEDVKMAYQHVQYQHSVIDFTNESEELSETLVFNTSDIEPLPIEKLSWDLLLKADTIEKGNFSLFKDSFLEFFNIRPDMRFNFDSFFCNEVNKPNDIELNVVWSDVDSNDKYGNIITLVVWKNETIGWFSCSGRWLETVFANTINKDKWTEMMNFIYVHSQFKQQDYFCGVDVYDINVDLVDAVCYIPGVSSYQYKE